MRTGADTNTDILHGELATEFKTVAAMIAIWCRDKHGGQELCEQCRALLRYAESKLDRCPYGEQKPACNRCPIHCYKPEPKEQMRLVMRYSGPRMLLPHPLLSIRHLLKERRAFDPRPPKDASNRAKRKMHRSDG